MDGTIHLDTLYLNVKYPYSDVFKYWYGKVAGAEYRTLKEGIAYGDFVIRNGASCYKVSVWQHDARVFLTDQVDEKVGEGKGSGIWVQLGPKFLIEHFYHLQRAVKELLRAVGVIGDYPIKINRLDIALDLFGVSMQEQDINLWHAGWVGRSKISDLHFNSRTGALETIYIGSRNSPIYLRVYDKVAQAVQEGDIVYWLDVWQGFSGPVTRVEWQIKPSDGKFYKTITDFEQLIPFSILETLNYLVDWGRLCTPNPDDSNNRRWKDAEFWQKVRNLIQDNSAGVYWPVSRLGKEFHGISAAYIKFLSGTLSGGMARLGLDNPNMVSLLNGLAENGQSLEDIQKTAAKKAAVISKL